MVSKNVTILSLLMPIAMVIGTSIAIEFSRSSSLMLLIFSASAGLMGCVYLMIKRSQQIGLSYEQHNLSSQLVATK
jgi:hypothetical protein